MAFRVTAPYVTVRLVAVPGGPATTHGFYAGAVLPPQVDRESALTQLRKGFVEEITDEVQPVEERRIVEVSDSPPAGPVRPAKNASKAAWVDYAVTQRADGADEAEARTEAEGLTHTELVAKYGS